MGIIMLSIPRSEELTGKDSEPREANTAECHKETQ